MVTFIPRCHVGNLDVTDYPFMLAFNELDLGAGQNAMSFFQALLADGEIGTSERTGNRVLEVPLYVEGADLLELARNEATLIAACEKARNTFSIEPGDGFAPTTVYDTFRIQATHVRDENEEGALLRRWNLTIPALPWARSSKPIVTTFAPVVPTITTLDDGSALTNWSLAPGSSPSTLATATWLSDAAIRVTQTTADNRAVVPRLSIAKPTTPYVAVDVARADGVSPYFAGLRGGGGTGGGNKPLASERLASGYTRFYFATPTAVPLDLDLRNGVSDADQGRVAGAVFYVGGVYGSTSLPATGVLMSAVEGSVRTHGVVTVSGSAALGHTMVYADPSMMEFGWQPDAKETWANAPEGTYAVYVQRSSGTHAAGESLFATVGTQTASTRTEVASTDTRWFPVGRLALGGRRDGRLGAFTLALSKTAGGTNIASEFKIRLFRMAPDTSLIHVRALTQTRLMVDLPSLEFPRGGVWAGAAGAEVSVLNQTDAWDYPTLAPPSTAYFVRADGVAAPSTVVEYHPRFHTFSAI